jgi:glycerol-3-phosphate cytidylyltransferase-like family protein
MSSQNRVLLNKLAYLEMKSRNCRKSGLARTVDMATEVSVSDMADAINLMQTAQQDVVVQGHDCTADEEDDPRCPAQVGHDQRRVPQNERRVHSRHQMESHGPPRIWKQTTLNSQHCLLQARVTYNSQTRVYKTE